MPSSRLALLLALLAIFLLAALSAPVANPIPIPIIPKVDPKADGSTWWEGQHKLDSTRHPSDAELGKIAGDHFREMHINDKSDRIPAVMAAHYTSGKDVVHLHSSIKGVPNSGTSQRTKGVNGAYYHTKSGNCGEIGVIATAQEAELDTKGSTTIAYGVTSKKMFETGPKDKDGFPLQGHGVKPPC